MTRIDDTFARLKADGKKAFVTFTMAGDPNYETSLEVMKGLPAAGADVIELGMPYMGVSAFLEAATEAGIDGLIVVDLPPEEDDELCVPANKAGLNFIRLATPTTDDKRLPKVLENTSGFVYYVAITGITGSASANAQDVAPDVARIQKASGLPVVVGFGIKTAQNARAIASVADGAVVGSAIVDMIGQGKSSAEVLAFVKELADGAHSA